MTLNKLLCEMTSSEIGEWMAFDRLKDEDYRKELESKAMTDEQRNEALKALLRGK